MTTAYADTRYQTMQAVQATEGIKAIAYDQQVALVESLLGPGMTVLDVGCGPALPYRPMGAFICGLDPSSESLAANTDVDERIGASAARIPFLSDSVDLVVAFYSVHHMTTQTIDGSALRRDRALAEMLRVVRPGGEVLVFEMTPPRPVWWFEWLLWDMAKAVLGDRLDMCFWPRDAYPGARVQTFDCSPFAMFAPIFSVPWLRIPRVLYPFTATLYRWKKGA